MHTGTKGYIDGDRVRVPGVNYGYGDSDPHLIHRGKSHLVLQKKGTQDWSSRGKASHYAAQWYLVHVEWLPEKKDHFKVLSVVDQREPGRKWHAARQELIAKVEQLETVAVETKVTAAEMKLLEKAFEAEINLRRFQSKAKLIAGMVEKGLLIEREENERVRGTGLTMHVEWLELSHLGRMLYCMSCDDVPDEDL